MLYHDYEDELGDIYQVAVHWKWDMVVESTD